MISVKRWVGAACVGLGLAATPGCPAELPIRSYVSRYLVEKAFLTEGEFWSQVTLVDSGQDPSRLFVDGYSEPVQRVRWEVSEDRLLARSVSPHDGFPAPHDGEIVAAYAIMAHVDVDLDQNRVIEVEPSRWSDARFMRVDWSRSLVEDRSFDRAAVMGIEGGVSYEPLDLYVSDPSSEDAPVIDPSEGTLRLTGKVLAMPITVAMGGEDLPSCAVIEAATAESLACDPAEIKLRRSFRRVADRGYHATELEGSWRTAAFGAATVSRFCKGFGPCPSVTLLARHDLWDGSFAADAAGAPVPCGTSPEPVYLHRDEDGDGTEDECAAVGRGSTCDVLRRRCTLPYRDRRTKTSVWHFQGPEDLFDPTEEAVHQWDVALRGAVAAARYVECGRTGGADCATAHPVLTGQLDDATDAVALVTEIARCERGQAYADATRDPERCRAHAAEIAERRGYDPAVLATAAAEPMAILCHDPVSETDPVACGARGTSVLAGDLAHHVIRVSEGRPLGPRMVYTPASDPWSGERLGDTIHVFLDPTDRWSGEAVDVLRTLGGELPPPPGADPSWPEAVRAAAGGGALPRFRREDVERRLAALAGVDAATLADVPASILLDPALADLTGAINAAARETRSQGGLALERREEIDARRDEIALSPVESALVSERQAALVGPPPQSVQHGAGRALASPLRLGNPAVWRERAQLWQERLAQRGACVLDDIAPPAGIAALAAALQAKLGGFDPAEPEQVQVERAERMRRYLAHRAHASLVAHALGHSYGLLHDLAASADAAAYRPQYWQLRTSDGTVTEPCTDVAADGATCVGPRVFDPYTDEEREQAIGMFMSSSAMDLPGDATQELMGLGAHDYAAVRLIYGDVALVHADASYGSLGDRGRGMLARGYTAYGVLGVPSSIGDRPIDPSALQKEHGLIQGCAPTDVEAFRPDGWSEADDGPWQPLLDGGLVKVKGAYTRCRQQRVDHVAWRDLRAPSEAERAGLPMSDGPAVDVQGRVRVPYASATDTADGASSSVRRRDSGADAFERTSALIARLELAAGGAWHRTEVLPTLRAQVAARSRSIEDLREVKALALLLHGYREAAVESGVAFDDLWAAFAPAEMRDAAFAASLAFDELARLVARPVPGEHGMRLNAPVLSPIGSPDVGATQVLVPFGAVSSSDGSIGFGGAPMEVLEGDAGPPLRPGSHYDKAFAGTIFTEPAGSLHLEGGASTKLEGRISLAETFPEAFRRWLATQLASDDLLRGARVAADGGGAPLGGADGRPTGPILWPSFWGDDVELCSAKDAIGLCSGYASPLGGPTNAGAPLEVAILDPTIELEHQKLLIGQTLLFLPAESPWTELVELWDLGWAPDPGFADRLELHMPQGTTYVARALGKETLLGATVQRGVAARILEHANALLAAAYHTTPGPDLDGDGSPDWNEAVIGPDGPVVRHDPSFPYAGCNAQSEAGCTCEKNRACAALIAYAELPAFLARALTQLGWQQVAP